MFPLPGGARAFLGDVLVKMKPTELIVSSTNIIIHDHHQSYHDHDFHGHQHDHHCHFTSFHIVAIIVDHSSWTCQMLCIIIPIIVVILILITFVYPCHCLLWKSLKRYHWKSPSAPGVHSPMVSRCWKAALLLCITLGLDTPLRDAPRALVLLEAVRWP